MTTISSNRSPARCIRASASALLLLAVATLPVTLPGVAGAQSPDGRFQPWLGCWVANNTNQIGAPTDGPGGMVCVLPAQTGAGVNVVSIANGKVIRQEAITGAGARSPKALEGCPGWESSTWSTDNHRLFLNSEYTCGSITKVKGSGIMSISESGEWVQVEGTTVGKNVSTAAIRYHAAGLELVLAPGQAIKDSMVVTTSAVATGFAIRSVRMLAGEPVHPDAVLDVTKHVDAPVAEAWVNELGQRFDLDGQTLVKLADAGMPSSMIDLMVALTYPQRFAVKRNEADSSVRGNRAYGYGRGGYGGGYGMADRMGCSPYGYYGDPWGSAFGYGMAYGAYGSSMYGASAFGCGGYGYNRYYGDYYYGMRPVIIVSRGSDSPDRATGHAVKGGGYTRDSGPTSSNRTARPDGSGSSGSSQPSTTRSSGSSGSGSSSSGSSSSGGSTGRTAHTRPPA